jgi:hypothetical protein
MKLWKNNVDIRFENHGKEPTIACGMVNKNDIIFESFVRRSVSWSLDILIEVFQGLYAFDAIYTKRKLLTFINMTRIANMI